MGALQRMTRSVPALEPPIPLVDAVSKTASRKTHFALVICLAIFAAVLTDNVVAVWLAMPRIGAPSYRRIGPQNGPQVLVAGSLLLLFGISWPAVSEALAQGIESWGLGGSSPPVWELFQDRAGNTNLTIIGVSTYDLNEYHVCDLCGTLVPVTQSIRDLW